MVCTPFTLNDGTRGIACGPRQRCGCGRPATLLCDWKTPQGKRTTCSRPICKTCTTKPAAGKDLCKSHALEWESMKARA